jgi:hypothetical protein
MMGNSVISHHKMVVQRLDIKLRKLHDNLLKLLLLLRFTETLYEDDIKGGVLSSISIIIPYLNVVAEGL